MAPNSGTSNPVPEPADGDDQFPSVLAACDEALAADGRSAADEPPQLRDRLARSVACVRLLRGVLPAPPPAAGRRLGDFEVRQELGRGGMGVVYEARQVSLNRRVALKVLAGATGLTPAAVARFRREAEAAARLHHPNIVPVYATGEAGGTHYYAMELVDGPSLDQVIGKLGAGADPITLLTGNGGPAARASTVACDRTAPESPHPMAGACASLGSDGRYFETVARLIAEVADALEYAHREGVIHRDIKPSNLLLAPDGRLRVNDFGLARVLEQPAVTATGDFIGTPAYMSPEQVRAGRTADRRTDIYSLGATLYELLAFRPPFVGEARAPVLSQVLQSDPVPPRRVNPGVPRDLETICLKAMEKDPARRYQSAAELAADLRRFLAGEPVAARRVGAVGRAWKLARRRPLVATLLAALVALGAAGAVAVTVLWRQAEASLAGERAARQDEAAQRELTEAELGAKVVLLARIDWEANRINRAAAQLGACPERHRGPEWQYLDRMCRAEVVRFDRPADGSARVALSPDGRRVAAVSQKELTLWDLGTRAVVFAAPVARDTDAKLGFTPDGRRLVLITASMVPQIVVRPKRATEPSPSIGRAAGTSGPRTVTWQLTIWNAAGGGRLRSERFAAPSREYFARSPAGLVVAAADGGRVHVRDLDSGATTDFAHGHREVRSVEFDTAGGRLLTTGGDDPIKIWEPATGRLLASLSGGGLPNPSLEPDRDLLSADARYLLRSHRPADPPNAVVTVWDVDRDRELMAIRTPFSSLSNTRFSPDGRQLATARDNVVWVWDVATGRETHVLRGHTDMVRGIAFGPDGQRLASIGQDGTVRVWDMSPYQE